jgi:multidrug efflux pump subunit AcrA (membrane-fusion protein)
VVSVTGELKSAKSLYFGPPSIKDVWNHTIAFMAPDGAVVRKGRPILRFDPQELTTKLRDKSNALNEKQKALEKAEIVAREQLAELRLQIEEAKAALDKARLKADIPESLLASRDYQENQLLLKQATLNYELSQVELAKEEKVQAIEIEILWREVNVLQVESQQLEASIKTMTIRAPNEGVVIHAVDRHGNKKSVGDTIWRGHRVLEFPDLKQLEAHLEIPERESARIRIGQKVRFSMDASPDQQFFGEIVELASVIHTRSRNQPEKIFDAKVSLAEPDTKLMRPGMSINAQIILDSGKGP